MYFEKNLRNKILYSLKSQGFIVSDNKLTIGSENELIRKIQATSREEKIKKHLNFLASQNGSIKEYIINGNDLEPEKIDLELRMVKPGSHEEEVFKWWNLIWWSIPYERAYGRQMRFVLWDKYHDKPFGLIGLQSAPLKMKIRDDYLGIKKEDRDFWVNLSMSAQRVGALPPYNQTLGGKMVAMALASKEVRECYRIKYQHYKTLLQKRHIPADLLFITTTGAFGKSSIYNRVKYNNNFLINFLGYTKGSGAFHIPEELYKEIIDLLEQNGVDTRRGYGYGPSRKRQLLSIGLKLLNLPDFEYHGIKRAFYLIPHVKNLYDIINKKRVPEYTSCSLDELCSFWKERWALKRAEKYNDWKSFKAADFWEKSQQQLNEIANG